LVCLGLCSVAALARAQPQDDAALAEEGRSTWPKGRSLWGDPKKTEPEPEEDLGPIMTTDELRRAYPDVELRSTPGTTITVGTSTIYPFQSIAFGIGTDVYPLPSLRLSSFLSCGFSPTLNEKWQFNLYGEVGVGVAVMRWHGEKVVELPVVAARLRREQSTNTPIARGIVPSSHALELEAGALTGYYDLYRCTENCTAEASLRTREAAGKQLMIPYAGLRYVYYRMARSQQAPFRSASRFQVAVDVLTGAISPPDPSLFSVFYNERPTRNPIGGRVVIRLPAFTCAILGPCFGLDLAGGYMPNPSDGLVSVSASVY
jgi:hypothetical protein